MLISKSTPDGFFTISIESEMWEEEGDEVPIRSIEQLVLELELVAAELKQFLIKEEKGPSHAH